MQALGVRICIHVNTHTYVHAYTHAQMLQFTYAFTHLCMFVRASEALTPDARADAHGHRRVMSSGNATNSRPTPFSDEYAQRIPKTHAHEQEKQQTLH